MGNTCRPTASPPRTTHTTLLREFHEFTHTPEYVIYKKLHPSVLDPKPREMLEALRLNTLCVRTTQTLKKGTHSLSKSLGDGLVGIGMRAATRPPCDEHSLNAASPTPFYRLLANEHVLVRGEASSSPPFFFTPTTPSLLFYTTHAPENPEGLTILMETVPLYALHNTSLTLELSDDAEVDFYTVYYPQPLLHATKNKKGKLQLQGHAWLYDPTAAAGEVAFFPDLPF
jgi:hypothetical protein